MARPIYIGSAVLLNCMGGYLVKTDILRQRNIFHDHWIQRYMLASVDPMLHFGMVSIILSGEYSSFRRMKMQIESLPKKTVLQRSVEVIQKLEILETKAEKWRKNYLALVQWWINKRTVLIQVKIHMLELINKFLMKFLWIKVIKQFWI